MTPIIHVVDYGVGNLYSVARAIQKVGGEARLSDDRAEIASAERLILPGVGAFRDGMTGLAVNGLDDAVREFAEKGRPLLGICLGMQMLATESLEFGRHLGLDLIPGQVVPLPAKSANGTAHKVPFVGWTELEATRLARFADTPLAGVGPVDAFYHVHSFHMEPARQDDSLAIYRYDGVAVTAAIARDNIFGCQFHPEKSGECGLRILGRFLTC